MQKNQKGFSVVGGLLILVIVGLLGGVGWYVWDSNRKSQDSLNNADKSIQASTKTSPSKLSLEIPSGWTGYQNEDLGIGFAYPKNWTFEDKSKEPTSTKSYYVGELVSDDKTTTVAITLMRKKDGRNTRASIEEWKAYATNSNVKYHNLAEVKSNYAAFSYVLDVSGATSLVYEVLEPSNNVEMVVLPTETNQTVTIEKIIDILRVE